MSTPEAADRQDIELAYTWGLPILAMYRYTVSMGTRVDGINQVFHNRSLFEPGQLPGGANRDTLYSFGWFDLADEPYVVTLPDFAGRYFVWQMTDVYAHNFANVGNGLLEGPTETYGSGYSFVLAGADWDGDAPAGLDVVRAPGRLVNWRSRNIGIDSCCGDVWDTILIWDRNGLKPGWRIAFHRGRSAGPC